jgi:hypothetical protein
MPNKEFTNMVEGNKEKGISLPGSILSEVSKSDGILNNLKYGPSGFGLVAVIFTAFFANIGTMDSLVKTVGFE